MVLSKRNTFVFSSLRSKEASPHNPPKMAMSLADMTWTHRHPSMPRQTRIHAEECNYMQAKLDLRSWHL